MNKIAIHSVPRSGSSWLGQIFNSSPDIIYKFQPLFSYALKGLLNENSTYKEIETFFSLLEDTNDDFLDQVEQKRKKIYPTFNKHNTPSYLVYKEVRYHFILQNLLKNMPDLKVVGIIRNPLEVISSWVNAPKEFEPNWEIAKEWIFAPTKNQGKKEEYFGYAKWKEVGKLFRRLKHSFPKQFYLLRYDVIKNNTLHEVKNLFEFCNVKLTGQTIDFIDQSTTKTIEDPYSVYRNKRKSNPYISNLPDEITNKIVTDLKDTELSNYLVNEQ